MNAGLFFNRPGPWLLWPGAIAGLKAQVGSVDLDALGIPPALRAGPAPGPAEEPRDASGRPWPGYAIQTTDGIAHIDVRGPIVQRDTPLDSLLATVLGWTVLEHTVAALSDARTNKLVRGVLLTVDSPGGEAGGIAAAARQIRELSRRGKPVVVHVPSLAASAGYWLASAASLIVADPASFLGSIGVMGGVIDDTGALEKAGLKRWRFTSIQSPLKNPDPATPTGADSYQEQVDSLADIFLSDVAGYRGTTALNVMDSYGGGDVLIAGEGLKVGMLDRIGSRSDALRELSRLIGAPAPRARVAGGKGTGTAPRVPAPEPTAASPPTASKPTVGYGMHRHVVRSRRSR